MRGKHNKMAVTESQKRAVRKYTKEHYDLFQVLLPKGKKDKIKEYATQKGLSVNQYINNAIDQQLKIDGFNPDNTPTEGD